ncbi:LpqN/LpqT family lipoprotein [Mycobacterium sp. M1]|uniref:LpqN/LpqT family lipoprotein n=1 Tax=Mycolicibacter acidiphilus TaxID=2835306 RepID=A0ABS5RIE1_9MYCO|nr:LpqN/LpqT family lipoprotein [Mycolicibacter acidiphilus]MBS9533787.1 LpqN/LpqT family lipoprotein [Mycolicibacter acidiphilus]
MTSLRRWVGCAALAAATAVVLGDATAAADPLLPVPPTPGYPPVVQPAAVPVPGTTMLPGGASGVVGMPPVGAPPVGLPPVGTPPAAMPPTAVPAASGTLHDYFAAHDVQLEPQQAAGFTALNLTLPLPPGWTQVPDPNVPDAFAVFADRRSGALYTPNVQLVVYRLVGHFDPKEAITHGFVDSRQQMAWQTTNASLADFDGFPSSVIEGTYREGDMTLNTSRRHVIVPAGANNYLVSLTVTTGAGRSVGTAPATDAIINGFRVSVPGSAPTAPAAPAPQPRVGTGH